MKEILKYLRLVKGYSQQTVADAIGVSRQSYNKYEVGTVVPSDKVALKLADFYRVDLSFIKANMVPNIPEKGKNDIYADVYPDLSEFGGFKAVASPSAACGCMAANTAVPAVGAPFKKKQDEMLKSYDAYYSRGKIVLKHDDLNLREGQNLKVTVCWESEEEEKDRLERSWKTIQGLKGKFKLPPELENLSYDELRGIALKEKYESF